MFSPNTQPLRLAVEGITISCIGVSSNARYLISLRPSVSLMLLRFVFLNASLQIFSRLDGRITFFRFTQCSNVEFGISVTPVPNSTLRRFLQFLNASFSIFFQRVRKFNCCQMAVNKRFVANILYPFWYHNISLIHC